MKGAPRSVRLAGLFLGICVALPLSSCGDTPTTARVPPGQNDDMVWEGKKLREWRWDLRRIGNAQKSSAACFALARAGQLAVDGLSKDVNDGSVFYVNVWAAQALCLIGPDAKEALPALQAAVATAREQGKSDMGWRNFEPWGRAAIVLISGESGDHIGRISLFLQDSDELVKMNACRALGQVGSQAKSALPALNRAKQDASKRVQECASEAITAIKRGQSTEQTVAQAQEPTTDAQLGSIDSEPARKAQIAFRSARDGNWEIYVMNVDGSAVRRLTENPARDDMPRWSPNGKQIVFRSERDGNQELYIMNSDGSQQRRLTRNPAKDSNACFSPDGSKILFASKRSGNWDLYTMRPDGANQKRFTDTKLDSGGGRYSPDGNKIVFMSPKDGNFEVYVMDSDGSNITRLTRNPAPETGAIFSPTGRQIAFTSTRDGNYEIYIIDVGGSGLKNVTKNPANDAACGFLDDNTMILVSDRSGDLEIYAMDLRTGKLKRLTNSPGADTMADVCVPTTSGVRP